jgi:hypothetical protein
MLGFFAGQFFAREMTLLATFLSIPTMPFR